MTNTECAEAIFDLSFAEMSKLNYGTGLESGTCSGTSASLATTYDYIVCPGPCWNKSSSASVEVLEDIRDHLDGCQDDDIIEINEELQDLAAATQAPVITSGLGTPIKPSRL